MKTRPARISLNVDDAEHVYEWLQMFWLGEVEKFGGCAWCDRIGRRLERLIGPARVRRTARLVKKHPGRAIARRKKLAARHVRKSA